MVRFLQTQCHVTVGQHQLSGCADSRLLDCGCLEQLFSCAFICVSVFEVVRYLLLDHFLNEGISVRHSFLFFSGFSFTV